MTPELNPNFSEETASDALLTTADISGDDGTNDPEQGEELGENQPVAEELVPAEELPPITAMVAEVEELVLGEQNEANEAMVSPEPAVDAPVVTGLKEQKAALEREIAALQQEKAQWYGQQFQQLQREMERLVGEGTRELMQKKAALEKEIEKLERRQERIQQEMRTTFAGASQELAIRVQGFKDYLVGSLQDLVSAADQLELGVGDSWESSSTHGDSIIENADTAPVVSFAEQGFSSQKRQIQALLEQYRTRPDYYGPPWQLRRTFEPIHAERIENWFFNLGGRGAILSLDSRLQNILVGSAAIAILNQLYGDRCRALILAATPERLGEWRRGLQDCLGISRSDFGPDRGIVLFESGNALIQRAERLVGDRQMPLVLVDETEEQIDLALLQFPLLLAFAPNYQAGGSNYF
ncbi:MULTISPECIES: DUF3086 domain-containing protein [unclassified Synechocystis]|uniref:DUF3086 domain-containing protein n=1 Tax=unclassified Synechocystis TaxID=2640012 RepID=UPI00040ED6F5|nr:MULTISPECIES: DUF3086 domain-containing protein [unclassified Synechocystis]AIE74140.1 hypothetical protein D082_16120 [Synechocystis sp. PCC 6714]MCT0252779.1 DUF3086 domain-containing protein [Synechocystis sp. CS-94]